MWKVYLVLCNDGTLYCGIAKDVELRLHHHNQGRGAKYTKGRRPVYLVWSSDPYKTRSSASKEEARIKKLSRSEKWELIKEKADEV